MKRNFSQNISYLSTQDQNLVKKALDFSKNAHQGQKRFSGRTTFEHALAVAETLVSWKADAESLASGLLHDVLEDTNTTQVELRGNFGPEVSFLVEGVTRLGKVRLRKSWFQEPQPEVDLEFQRQVETLRRMFLAMGKDIRVTLIKLADRLDNMKDLWAIPDPLKKVRIAKETIEIFAPLAYRLGMGELKGELEDLAFPYAYPKEHQNFRKLVGNRYQEQQSSLEKVKKIVSTQLAKSEMHFEIHGRAKHFYSLYRKWLRYERDLTKIYDLVALRIILPTVSDCYQVLGIIHQLWKPLIGRIKDYIAQPKPNGYQSLHTTVFGPEGEIVEFQIRTNKMHELSERGLAAHWYYSERKYSPQAKSIITTSLPRNLEWTKELSRWSKDSSAKDVADLKLDFFEDRIFVFTPKGDVIDLPEGASPIDFAYAIHSEIGNSLIGAKVNGKLTNLSQKLSNGDVVEILTAKTPRPKKDWLMLVKTAQAKSKIRKALKELGQ